MKFEGKMSTTTLWNPSKLAAEQGTETQYQQNLTIIEGKLTHHTLKFKSFSQSKSELPATSLIIAKKL